MKKLSNPRGQQEYFISANSLCFFQQAFSERLLYAKHTWFFLVKQNPPMDAENVLGLYVYNECARMLPSCFYKANVTIPRTQIHSDNNAQRSDLVACPTFYRYGKRRAYKTVEHKDKRKEFRKKSAWKKQDLPFRFNHGEIWHWAATWCLLIPDHLLAFSSTCWEMFSGQGTPPVLFQRLALWSFHFWNWL